MEKIYMVTIRAESGDKIKQWETQIKAPNIFQAAEMVKADCKQDWLVIAIVEVDVADW